MFNINSRKFVFTAILFVCFFSNIYGENFYYNKMNLRNYVSSDILPLQNMGSKLNSSQISSITNGFFTAGTENFGYFRITLSNKCTGEAKGSKAAKAGAWVGTILTGGIYTFAGGSVGKNRYQLIAKLEIFDCNRKIIMNYTDSTFFVGNEKLWSEADYTFKTEDLYRQLLRNCLLSASAEADIINAALLEAKYPPPPLIETTAKKAFEVLSKAIPEGSKIAIINKYKSTNLNISSLQLESHFANTNKYYVVDRTTLDLLLTEIAFSHSAFVSDADAITVGRMMSADYLISIHIEGDEINKNIVYRAVEIETSVVIASYICEFQN